MEYTKLYLDNGRVVDLAPEAQRYTARPIVTCSPRVEEQLSLLERIADTPLRVLICAEQGTDLQQYAEYLHGCSNRRDGPYIRMDCGAVHAAQCEEKLFGACYAGKDSAHIRKGVVELARGGTLLLDNLSALPQPFHRAVAQLMDTGTFTPKGGGEPVRADVRLVATGTVDPDDPARGQPAPELQSLVAVTVTIPPLRERPEDVALLALWYLQLANERYNSTKHMGSDLLHAILSYSWPGNEWELKRFVDRAVLMAEGSVLNDARLLDEMAQEKTMSGSAPATVELSGQSLKEMVSEYELLIIRQSIRRYGSLRKAAKALQIAPSALSRKLSAAEKET